MKTPMTQFSDEEAHRLTQEFITVNAQKSPPAEKKARVVKPKAPK